MVIVGHRGAAGNAPENTQAAILEAKRQGCSWIEVDVQLSLDHEAVIFHDTTLERSSNGRGHLSAHSLRELQQLDYGTWYSPQFEGEALLSLKQCLDLCMRLNFKINLELKLVEGQDPNRLVAVVQSCLDESRFACDDILISSFDHQVLKIFQKDAPHYRYGHLFDHLPDNWLQQCEAIKAQSCHCNIEHLSRAQAQAVKEAGYQLILYTVNQVEQIEPIKDLVDIVISDYPERFLG
ncbi:glycerophosphoryl diester phosphodiesterase [Alginatibacterium sediminis]|uniref:Glycerophosphoryl diester phosphodiesterase n=1 Tax=Alginatibacterium sediminis TaxID=2164068 RepID=A0A420ECX5_9ALTE|nr:glycerophosphodiester phosphodiesterase family protein [Alginatibacterium sediminis]RKF18521.1 glycerophosphoryl diester phosphodiesterase [Alginatibacterium sediminis]